MAAKKDEKAEVRSGTEAGDNTASEKAAPKKPKETKKKGKSFKENTIRDTETAKTRGRNGGVKSGEVRRAKRDARDTIRYMLDQMTKSKIIRDNLKELGFAETEFSNMAALHGRLFTMAMGGNLEAYMTLMRMGGYEPEENRRERESLSADQRRNTELEAKVTALGQKGENASIALNLNDEDDNNDVVIYMPQIAPEESCEVPPEKEESSDSE